MPNDVKARLIDISQLHGVPVDEVIKQFLEWKMGIQIQAILYNEPGKEKAKR
jgi:hypothetical protein